MARAIKIQKYAENPLRTNHCIHCTKPMERHYYADYSCYQHPAWTPPPATSPAYQVIPPDMFLELGQGSRDREVLAMEEAVSEDLQKLAEADKAPIFERFVKDMGIVLESLQVIENTSSASIKIHTKMTIHDTINRSVHRGELIVAKNTSRRISEALATLDKSLKALEQRNK